MVRDFAEVPRDAERVIFFPPAAGGMSVLGRAAATRAEPPLGPGPRAPRRAPRPRADALGLDDATITSELGFISVPGRGDPASGYALPGLPAPPARRLRHRRRRAADRVLRRLPTDDGERLPDADDVLAKWIALQRRRARADRDANIIRPGARSTPATCAATCGRAARAWRGCQRSWRE